MCRMFFQCSTETFNISYDLLKKFVKSCHWTYFHKYNVFGHHNCGWGVAYFPDGKQNLVVKRDINPIYYADWKSLINIKTRFLLVHARKTVKPWKKAIENVHPINIKEKYLMTHNGTIKIDSFPKLKDAQLNLIKKKTEMDTRKYLCLIMDELKQNGEIKSSIQSALNKIDVSSSANAFLFNSKECIVIKRQKSTFNGRHTTLFLKKANGKILVSTTPLDTSQKAMEIPNNSLIKIDLNNLKTEYSKLEIT